MDMQNMSKNLQYTRRRLKLSQKQFVDSFITDESGNALCSVPKLSNLENKGGNNLDRVCSMVADRLGMQEEDFSLEPADFTGRLEESLNHSDISHDKEIDDIVHEADQHSELVAFIRTLSNYLTDLLLADELLPGAKIPSERSLSRQFNVSRSVARETLKVLNVLGMIDIIPGKGTFIAKGSSDFFITPISWAIYLTDKNSDDVFFVRRSIEESTVGVACRYAGEEDFAALENILEKTYAAMNAEDYKAFSELDIEFHMTVVSASHNDVAVSLLTVLRKLSRSISQKGMANVEQMRDIYNEHSKLFQAIKASDPVLARQTLVEHFEHTHERYILNISSSEG